MKHTSRQTTHHTLADLYRAHDNRRPVTITYLKEEKDDTGKRTGRLTETIRTIEIDEIRTTKAGHVTLRAADRQSGEMRTWRLDRIQTYTVHRGTYQVELPDTEHPAPPVFHTEHELTAYEIAREDHAYWDNKYDELDADTYDHAA
jgi:predicted DNA-binding transcriptional regulator YafY